MAKIGDIIEIPLSDGRKAYGQYVYKDKMGPMIKIFNIMSEEPIDINQLIGAKELFPPIITGVSAAIKAGLWKVVGHLSVEGFVYPDFISTNYDQKTGMASIWFLWNGNEYQQIGKELPAKYKKLEYLIVWSPYDVMHRIETGEYLFPYNELIQNNKFTPHRT